MRFLANESFPLKSIYDLRSAGHDVIAVIEASPGAKDEDILIQASSENRIILTFDRDYGELVYRHNLATPAGVIYFRFTPATPEEPAEYLFRLLSISELLLEDKFTVVERGRIRQRPLP